MGVNYIKEEGDEALQSFPRSLYYVYFVVIFLLILVLEPQISLPFGLDQV